MKQTRIICTIGPASQNTGVLEQLAKSGMNIARLNFSHGAHEDHMQLISNIRHIAKKTKKQIAILQDLQGPKIRFGDLPEAGIPVSKNEKIILVAKKSESSFEKKPKRIPVGYKNLHTYCKKGDRLFFDDALIEARVVKKEGSAIHVKISNGGIIKSHKGINVPDAEKTITSLTAKDKADLEFGIQQEVDFIALSFVQSEKDISQLKKHIIRISKKYKKESTPKIIAKIEKSQAIKNIKKIIEEADAILIARGDLGIEIPIEDVPVEQKKIIQKCMHAGKPVIVATQMLESMIKNPRPTRAEVSDVANAVIDHVDAVMLSGETAVGKYPVKTIQTMKKIITETEESPFDDVATAFVDSVNTEEQIAASVVEAVRQTHAQAIILNQDTKHLGVKISALRPEVAIVVPHASKASARKEVLFWGISPIFSKSNSVKIITRSAVSQKIIKKTAKKIIVTSNKKNKYNIAIES